MHVKGSEGRTVDCAAGYTKCMDDIVNAISVLKMRADSFVSYADYILSRAEAQVGVVGTSFLNGNR